MTEHKPITEYKTRKLLAPNVDYIKVHKLLSVPSNEMDKEQIAELLMPFIDKKAKLISLQYIKSESNDFDHDSCKSVMLTRLVGLMEENNLKFLKNPTELQIENYFSKVLKNAVVDEFRRLHGRDTSAPNIRKIRLEHVDPRVYEEGASPKQLAFLNYHKEGDTPLDALLDRDSLAIPERVITKIADRKIITPQEQKFLTELTELIQDKPKTNQADVARKMGLSESMISLYIRGIKGKISQKKNMEILKEIMENEGLSFNMKRVSDAVCR